MNALMPRFSLCFPAARFLAHSSTAGQSPAVSFFYSGILRSNSARPIAPISIIADFFRVCLRLPIVS